MNAPLPAPSANLPQPWYPGFNDVGTGAGETIDPNYIPNRSDEFTLSVQHQFNPRILAEVGYIGRILSNEDQYYSLTAVPYMMTRGGQTFANAWAQIMVATNYGAYVPSPTLKGGGANPAYLPYLNALAAQPFFENSLAPGYCNGSALGSSGVSGLTSCTAQLSRKMTVITELLRSIRCLGWRLERWTLYVRPELHQRSDRRRVRGQWPIAVYRHNRQQRLWQLQCRLLAIDVLGLARPDHEEQLPI